MTVKVVTDTSADLPIGFAEEAGVTIVPLYVRFGEEIFRMGVDITDDEFYQRLTRGPVHPTTIQPSPQDFVTVYRKLMQEGASGIVSIHISSKLSGTHNSALQAKQEVGRGFPIEVIDSQSVTLGLGLIVVAAANAAKAGANVQQVVEETKKAMSDYRMLGLFDTLKYLALGGRIGKAKALLGSVLNVKPMLTLKDGETVPAGQVRTRAKGINRLVEFAQSATEIRDLTVGYNTTPDEANALADRLSPLYKEKIKFAKIGPVLGVHGGPGILLLAFRGKLKA